MVSQWMDGVRRTGRGNIGEYSRISHSGYRTSPSAPTVMWIHSRHPSTLQYR